MPNTVTVLLDITILHDFPAGRRFQRERPALVEPLRVRQAFQLVVHVERNADGVRGVRVMLTPGGNSIFQNTHRGPLAAANANHVRPRAILLPLNHCAREGVGSPRNGHVVAEPVVLVADRRNVKNRQRSRTHERRRRLFRCGKRDAGYMGGVITLSVGYRFQFQDTIGVLVLEQPQPLHLPTQRQSHVVSRYQVNV